ncbi:hypothetical protein V8E54_000028 [Elaphomyces granulatus]
MPLIPVFFSIQQTLNFMKNKIFDLVAMGNPAFKSQVYPTALEAVPSGWLPSSGNNENDFAAVDFEPDELLLTSWLHLDRRQILVGSWSHVACLTAGIGDHPFGHDSEDAADCFDDGQVKRQEPVISYAIRGCIRDYDYVRSDDAGNGLARQTLNAINTLNSKKQFDNRMEIVEAVLDQNEIAPQPTGGAGIAKNRVNTPRNEAEKDAQEASPNERKTLPNSNLADTEGPIKDFCFSPFQGPVIPVNDLGIIESKTVTKNEEPFIPDEKFGSMKQRHWKMDLRYFIGILSNITPLNLVSIDTDSVAPMARLHRHAEGYGTALMRLELKDNGFTDVLQPSSYRRHTTCRTYDIISSLARKQNMTRNLVYVKRQYN